jgi:ankyrin repeat protein
VCFAAREGVIKEIVGINVADVSGETCLSTAIRMDNVEFVQFVLDQGADINYVGQFVLDQGADINYADQLSTHLKLAVELNNIMIAKLLLERGADPNLKYPLYRAFLKVDENMIKLLLEFGADPNPPYFHDPSLFFAIRYCSTSIIKLLIELGADINAVSEKGRTVFYEACKFGKLEIVKIIANMGGNCHAADDKTKPIEIAAKKGFVQVVEYLSKDLGSPLFRSLYFASRAGWVDVVEYLLEFGPFELGGQYDPLEIACSCGNIDVVDRILKKNIDLQQYKITNNTSYIMGATWWGHLGIVKRLVAYGDDFLFKNIHGENALYLACYLDDFDCAEFLIGLGVDLNCVIENGDSCLMAACKRNNIDIVKLLIKEGADVSLVNNRGKKAIDFTQNDRIKDLFK